MGRNGDAVFPLDGRVADDMVDVAVGVDGHQGFQPVAVDEAEELVFAALRIAARVNDDAFLGGIIIDDISVLREWIKDERFYFKHTSKQ